MTDDSVVVVIPWSPLTRSRWRYRWRQEVVAFWELRGFEVVIGLGEWGIAPNQAIERTDAEVIVVGDADTIVAPAAVQVAVALAEKRDGLILPHDQWFYLPRRVSERTSVEEAATRLTVAGRWPVHAAEKFERSGQLSVGGVVVFSRQTWERAGRYDEDIVHGYDACFALACGTLVAEQVRLPGDLIHFWHPRPEIEDPPETWATIGLYEAAAEAGPEAMAALVEQRRRGR